MKSFGMLKILLILVDLGAALVFSPACKAQKVSPDHFTDTGVQDVYESAPGKAVAARLQRKPPATEARMHLTNSPATRRPAVKAHSCIRCATGAQAVADKRKPVPSTPKNLDHPSRRAADSDLGVGR
jgi:hypothetical protein